jgi:hypothetical protein
VFGVLEDQTGTDLQCGGDIVAPSGSLVIGVTVWGPAFPSGTVTPDAEVTEDDDLVFGAFNPAAWFAHRVVGVGGTVQVSGTRTSTDWGGVSALFVGTEPAWTVPAPNVIDDDDATYDAPTSDTELVRIDLGAEYRIVRTRIRLQATAGSETLTIKAATLADFSDEATLDTIAFTATGSPQDLEASWLNTDTHRFFELSGTSSAYRIHAWELYEPTLSQNHTHENIDSDAVMDAGRWELAVIPDAPPDTLYADGDWLYIWVPGS